MSVNITVERLNKIVDSVECIPGAVTATVEDKLIKAYGGGLLKQGKFVVNSETLPEGDYVFHVTAPLGGCPIQPLVLSVFICAIILYELQS